MGVVENYMARLTLAGYRPETIRARKRCLLAFRDSVPDITRASRDDCAIFLARPLAPASRQSYASHLRMFFRYLREEGIREDDPTDKLPKFRVPGGIPRPIGHDDLSLAIERADNRMRCWLLLMALSGLRSMEVAALEPRDIVRSEDGAMLHLRVTKGGRADTVPLHPDVLACLDRLPISHGLWWDVQANTVSTGVRRYLHSLGIDASGHGLRHFAGTAWYRASGHDLLATARLMRHQNVRTTQIYARLDDTRPAEVVAMVGVPGLAS